MKLFKNKKGFTLIELIGVIAVIAIVVGIAIPAISKIKKSTGEMQEDDYAKSVFLAAQDNLSYMKVNGDIVQLSKTGGDTYPSVYTEEGGVVSEIKTILGNKLADELYNADVNKEYVYISKRAGQAASELFLKILPQTSIDQSILNKDILIIFNKNTGDIFYVKYGDGVYQGSIVSALEEIIRGGGNDDSGKEKPTVIFDNKEVCELKVSVPCPENWAEKSQDEKKEYINDIEFVVSIALAGEDTGEEIRFTNVWGDNQNQSANLSVDQLTGNVVTLTLDSLVSGYSFEELYGSAFGVKSGDTVDIKVTCEAVEGSEAKTVVSDKTVPMDGVTPCFGNIENNTIEIFNGRHLQNLNKLSESAASQINQVKLVGNISWRDTVTQYQEKYGDVSGLTLPFDFSPLQNTKLFRDGVTLNGNGKYIYYLYIEQSDNAGLFKTLKGGTNKITVENLTIWDPVIQGGGNVGSLAGDAENVNINGCRVRISSEGSGGAEKGAVTTGTGANVAAGLLCGTMKNVKVQNLKIDTGVFEVLMSGSSYGLVAGKITGSEITVDDPKCQIQGNIIGNENITQNSAVNIGLVAGEVNGLKLENYTVNGTLNNMGKSSSTKINVGTVGKSVNGTYTKLNVTNTVKKAENAEIGGLVGLDINSTFTEITMKCSVPVAADSDLGGITGYANGGTYTYITVNNMTVGKQSAPNENVNFDYFSMSATGCKVGGMIGQANGNETPVVLNKKSDTEMNTVNISFDYLYNTVTVGGAIGWAEGNNNVIADTTVNGRIQHLIAQSAGGFVGVSYGGSYNNDHTNADMHIYYAWSSSEGRVEVPNNADKLVSFFDSTVDLYSLGDHAFTTSEGGISTGYVGKFAGYIREGSYINCSGRGNTANQTYTNGDSKLDYGKMQFVGCIYCYSEKANTKSLFSGTANKEVEVEATKISASSYKGTDIDFTLAGDQTDVYRYSATLGSKDDEWCIYTDAEGKDIKQIIGEDSLCFYVLDERNGTRITAKDNIMDSEPFIIIQNGYILTVKKQVIKAGQIYKEFKKEGSELYRGFPVIVQKSGRYVIPPCLWNSKSDYNNLITSCYFVCGTNQVYYPNGTDTGLWTAIKKTEVEKVNDRQYAITNDTTSIYSLIVEPIKLSEEDMAILEGSDIRAIDAWKESFRHYGVNYEEGAYDSEERYFVWMVKGTSFTAGQVESTIKGEDDYIEDIYNLVLADYKVGNQAVALFMNCDSIEDGKQNKLYVGPEGDFNMFYPKDEIIANLKKYLGTTISEWLYSGLDDLVSNAFQTLTFGTSLGTASKVVDGSVQWAFLRTKLVSKDKKYATFVMGDKGQSDTPNTTLIATKFKWTDGVLPGDFFFKTRKFEEAATQYIFTKSSDAVSNKIASVKLNP